MKHTRNFTTFITLLCGFMMHHMNCLPQVGRNWYQTRPNATTYNNRWQQKPHTTRIPTQNQQANWQANGGWNWLIGNNDALQQQQQSQWQQKNQTIGNPSNYNANNFNNNWLHGNGTGQVISGSYQPQGERVWLNSNKSNPFIQALGARNQPSYATTKQPHSLGGWVAPQQYPNFNGGSNVFGQQNNTQPNYWVGPQNNPTTRQPAINSGWQGNPIAAGTWNNARATHNSTTDGQRGGINGHVSASTLPPNSNWFAPASSATTTNWKAGAANSTGNSGSLPQHSNQWNNGGNSYPAGNINQPVSMGNNNTAGGQRDATSWHAHASTPPPNSDWFTPANPASNTNWRAGVANNTGNSGSLTQHSNQSKNGGTSHPAWNTNQPGSTANNAFNGNDASALTPIGTGSESNTGSSIGQNNGSGRNTGLDYSGSVPLVPLSGSDNNQLAHAGGSSFGTPLAPLAGSGGVNWNPNASQAGLSYGQQQQPQTRPTGNSNPYANLFA